MAAPREINIIPKCGLEIEITEEINTDSSLPWEYFVTNRIMTKDEVSDDVKYHGWLSPFSLVTLPVDDREVAGIPAEARWFAFLYPPQELAENIKREVASLENKEKEESIISAITMGGFAYFGKDKKVLWINSLSREKKQKEYNIGFTGPFQVNESTCDELQKKKKKQSKSVHRAQPIQLDAYREAGFVRFAWVGPEEKINFKSVFRDQPNKHGAFLFFHENGEAEGYAVGDIEAIDSNGYMGILSDVFGTTDGSSSNQQTIKPIPEVKAWKEKYKHLMRIDEVDNDEVDNTQLRRNITELVQTLDDKKTLVHMLCHADVGLKFLSLLLKFKKKKYLSYKDGFGWTPLHYACRFSKKKDIIKLLVEAHPKAVQMHDNIGRYPLHIACDGDTSTDVITTLISADKSPAKVTVTSATVRLNLRPIHFACYQSNVSENTVKALIEADENGFTIRTSTINGQLPLHLAIIKKLPPSIVKMLIDTDSKIKPPHKSDVYHYFDGKIPLHWACWNNSSTQIIEFLLEKDENNSSVHEEILDTSICNDLDSPYRSIGDDDDVDIDPRNTDLDRLPSYTLIEDVEQVKETSPSSDGVALHLAMKHGNVDIICLLLQTDYEISKTLYRRDKTGRTPLHIASEHNVDPQIIHSLLKLDLTRGTTLVRDKNDLTPLHYACRNETTSIKAVDMLCEAEQLASSQHTKTSEQGKKVPKSPLYLAIKARSDDKVIERLLQPEKYCFEGFDEKAVSDLAKMIQGSEAIQNKIIEILSDRIFISLLMLEFYANVIALAYFIYGSSRLKEGNGREIEPIILLCCAVVFILRELQNFVSVGKSYFRDYWNLIELACIFLLLFTVVHMFEKADKPELKLKAELLYITGFFLVIQSIIFLRSTFRPFATFVGGLLAILINLIPFMIILILLLWVFAFSYWITDENETISQSMANITGNLFNFEPNDDNTGTGFLDVLFGVTIIIVLLNVVIAIVSETWSSSETRSSYLLWESRLEKILQLRYAIVLRDRNNWYPGCLRFIDNFPAIRYQNDISWTKEPYDLVTNKEHYDSPHKFFDTDVAAEICKAKSLRADLYWAEMDIRNNEKNGSIKAPTHQFITIFKWLRSSMLYLLLIILGTFTCGIFWPVNFRIGLLSVGYYKNTKEETSDEVHKKKE